MTEVGIGYISNYVVVVNDIDLYYSLRSGKPAPYHAS